jgi:hypothetical protein
MKVRRRQLSIFTLSALDVLAMSTGVFVLLLVILMPYYRKVHDAHAELAAVRVAEAETASQVRTIADHATLLAGEAATLEADVARLAGAAASIEAETAAGIRRAQGQSNTEVEGGGNVKTPVIDKLDLVFAIDTTASMGPVLGEVAAALESVVRILESLLPSVRVGVVAYRDRDTGLPPIRVLPLRPAERELAEVIAFIESLAASPVGSLTIEEDVNLGLQAAIGLPMRADARQAIVVVGDAAAHEHEQPEALSRARLFVGAQELRSVSALFTATPSSAARGNRARNFFMALASAGNGDFNNHTGSMIESIVLSVLVAPEARS